MSKEDEAKVPDSDSSDSSKKRPEIELTGEARKAVTVERGVPADAREKPTTKDKGD